MIKTNLISIKKIEKAIYLVRGEKVIPDRDLANLYGVTTAALNQAMRRNCERFPKNFMFQLTATEVAELNRSQIVIGSQNTAIHVHDPMLLPNRTSLCFPLFYAANAR